MAKQMYASPMQEGRVHPPRVKIAKGGAAVQGWRGSYSSIANKTEVIKGWHATQSAQQVVEVLSIIPVRQEKITFSFWTESEQIPRTEGIIDNNNGSDDACLTY